MRKIFNRHLSHSCVSRFIADQRGATAIEYALLASLLSVTVLAAVFGTGGGTGALFAKILSQVSTAIDGVH